MDNNSPFIDLPAPARVAWIDLARVFTMLGTMLAHVPANYFALQQFFWFSAAGRMSLLFMVAGFFMGKNSPQGFAFPQLGRAKRIAAAYVLLILIYIFTLGFMSYWSFRGYFMLNSYLESGLWGKLEIIFHLFGMGESPPGPFWFLRDLLVLCLLCGPLIWLKNKGLFWLCLVILPGLFIGYADAYNYFRVGGLQVTHPRALSFFALGFLLSGVSIMHLTELLRRYRLAMLLGGIAVVVALFMLKWTLGTVGVLAYMAAQCSLALYCETLFPRFARYFSRWGESVFFVYVFHVLVFASMVALLRLCSGNECAHFSPWLWWLMVPVIYGLIHTFGMWLKRRNATLFDFLAIRPPKRP